MSGSYPALDVGQGVPAPANPLALAQQAQSFQSNGLAILQQRRQLAAQLAVGRAMQAATDSSGNTDYKQAAANIAADPDAAPLAGQAMQDNLSQANTAAGTANTQQATLAAKAGVYAHAMQSLITKGASVTPADVTAVGQDMVNTGMFTPQDIAKEQSNMPTSSGQALQDFVARHQAQAGQVLAQLGVTAPSAVVVRQGGRDTYTTQNAGIYGGGLNAPQPGSVVKLGLSPTEQAGQIPRVNPTTLQPENVTVRQQLRDEGAGDLTDPPPPGAVPGSDKYPWLHPQGQGGAAPAPTTPRAVVMGPAPGVTGAAGSQQLGGAQAAQALVDSAADRPNRMAAINNMLGDLTQFTSGPGWNGLVRKSFATLNNFTGLGVDEKGIEAAQSFDKVGQQIANSQAKAMGSTNEVLTANMHANPNSSLQTGTNQQILHTYLGNEDAIQAKANAWQQALKRGAQPGDFNAWNNNFNQNFDPRAYQMRFQEQRKRHVPRWLATDAASEWPVIHTPISMPQPVKRSA